MSEELRLSPALLPAEKHYRPLGRGRTRFITRLVLLALVVYAMTWLAGRIFSRWFMLPAPEDFTIGACVVAALAHLWRHSGLHALLTENDKAVALIETGETAEAARRLDVLCRSLPTESAYHALFVFNRGVCALRAGRPDQAISLFAAVLDSGSFENPRHSLHVAYPLLFNGLAAAYAIKGDIATAERWQGLAHDHITPERAGLLMLNDVCIGIRSGRSAVVVHDAEANWAKAEGCLPGAQMQALRVLCAFALANTNPNGVSDAKIRQFLEAVQPCRPAQFDYLAINWPEFRAFLAEHGLTAPQAEPAAEEQSRRRQKPQREAQG